MPIRARFLIAACLITPLMPRPVFAQVAITPDNKPAKIEFKFKPLIVSPKGADPEPLRPRLLPLESERTPGDAAPIYLRLRWELADEAIKQINDKSTAWLDGPIADLPLAEARGFIDQWTSRLKQVEYAARRKTVDWNYTVPEEREDAIAILLPDVQGLRVWGRLLAIKARVEIAEKKFDEAARTIETGLSMARHIAEGPFLINGLVGIAHANIFLNRVEEFIAQPGAPNLYWPLTALPRPLVSLQKGLDTEHVLGDYLVPEMANPSAKRTDAEWTSLVARLHARCARLTPMLNNAGAAQPPKSELATLADLVVFRVSALAEANELLKRRGMKDDGMTDDQKIVVAFAAEYHESRDVAFRPFHLPYPEAVPFHEAAEARGHAAKGPASRLFAILAPSVGAAHLAECRLDRRVAAIRAVEALRMQAEKDGGKLPESLAKVTIVPVPVDPLSGKPFESRRDGDAIVIESPTVKAPNSAGSEPGLSYRIILRD